MCRVTAKKGFFFLTDLLREGYIEDLFLRCETEMMDEIPKQAMFLFIFNLINTNIGFFILDGKLTPFFCEGKRLSVKAH